MVRDVLVGLRSVLQLRELDVRRRFDFGPQSKVSCGDLFRSPFSPEVNACCRRGKRPERGSIFQHSQTSEFANFLCDERYRRRIIDEWIVGEMRDGWKDRGG